MAFQLPDLPYDFGALEPYIDGQTMEIHHGKHHGGYTGKLNDAIKGTHLDDMSIENILSTISTHSTAVRNNGGGYYNHDLFWKIMQGGGVQMPEGVLGADIENTFGGFEAFKNEFSAAAATRFGSGWAWLLVDESGKLVVSSTPNQDNPLMDLAVVKGTPILGLDVWEHAYYLKYQNRRPEYIENFFKVINWDAVAENYSKAK
jgi:Fe-Mn family superoxide dismutase